MEIAVSIDIGGTTTKLALVNRRGEIVARREIPTQSSTSAENYFDAIFFQVKELAREFAPAGLAGIGIGAPGCNERDGTIVRTANLLFKEPFPIRDLFRDHFGLPAFLIKDSTAAAWGERLFGGARGMDNFVLLTLGTGLGAGIFLNGAPVTGATGLASELGHITVDRDGGRRCGCGRRGCLETYVSATGLRRTVFELLARELPSGDWSRYSFDTLTARDIAEAARRGDSIALQAFDITGRVLGTTIADLAAAFEPEAVFLSGGLAQAGELLLKPTTEHLESRLLSLMRGRIRVLSSRLGANDAALLGAASLVLHHQNEQIT